MRGKFLMLVGAAVDVAVVSLAPRSSFDPSYREFAPPPPSLVELIPPPSKLGLAVAVLREARFFTGAWVGNAGETPEEVWAWRVVLHSDQARQAFLSVFAQGTLEGRMFALAGLSLVDRGAYEALAAWLRPYGGMVRTLVGCVAEDQQLSEVLSQIDDGSWVRQFLAGRLTPLPDPALKLAAATN